MNPFLILVTVLSFPTLSCQAFWPRIDQKKLIKLLDQWINDGNIDKDELTKLNEYFEQTQVNLEAGLPSESEMELLKRIGILLGNKFISNNPKQLITGTETEEYSEWLVIKIAEIRGLEELIESLCSNYCKEVDVRKLKYWSRICALPERNDLIENLLHRWLNGQALQRDHLLIIQSFRWLFGRLKNFARHSIELGLWDMPLFNMIGDKFNEQFRAGIVAGDRLLKRMRDTPEVEALMADVCTMHAQLTQEGQNYAAFFRVFLRDTCRILPFNRWLEGSSSPSDQKPLDQLAIAMEQWQLDKNWVPIPDKADRDLMAEVISTVTEFVAEIPGQEGRALRALFGNALVGNNLEKLCNSGRSMQQQMGAPVERSAQFCKLFDELQHIERFIEEAKNPTMSISKLKIFAKRIRVIWEAAYLSENGKGNGLRERIEETAGELAAELGEMIKKIEATKENGQNWGEIKIEPKFGPSTGKRQEEKKEPIRAPLTPLESEDEAETYSDNN